MKQCIKCKETKNVSEFNKNYYLKDNLQNTCKDCQKLYYQNNKKRILENNNIYRLNNIEAIRKQNNLSKKNKIKNDILFKLKHNIRNTIYRGLKNKNISTTDVIGCDYNFLIEWLKYEDKNQKFEIDHVIPLSLAKNEKEILSLNHYSNLQLLSSSENKRKSNKRIKKVNLLRVLSNHNNIKNIKDILSREKIQIIY